MKKGKRLIFKSAALTFFLSFFFSFFFSFFALPLGGPAAWAAEYAPGEALVVLKNGIGLLNAATVSSAGGKSYVASVASSVGASAPVTYAALSEASDKVIVLMRSATKSTEELIADLEKNPNVENASPNYRVYAAERTPNDPIYGDGSLWGMKRIRAHEAWDTTTGGDNVYVAVIDSGITPNHEDLAANFDATLSKNFTSSSSTPARDDNYMDEDGHGTHVSGTIAAVGNNGLGVTGVNWKAKIIALRALAGEEGGHDSWIIAALNYVAELLQADPDLILPAVNLSLGGWSPYTPQDAVSTAEWLAYKAVDQTNRAVIVVAAGNEASQIGAPATVTINDPERNIKYDTGDYCYPASFIGLDNMIVVGAIDSENDGYSRTNWSSEAVHVVAPGVDIISTYLQGYDSISGTSMATPHVTGAAALLASGRSDITPTASMLKELLLANANPNINPKAPASIPGVVIPPQSVPDTTVSKHGLIDGKKAMDALLNLVIATNVEVTPSSANLSVGNTVQLNATVTPQDATVKQVSWSSDKTGVATVDQNGQVIAVAAGTAVITAKTMDGSNLTASANITVAASSLPGLPPTDPALPPVPTDPTDPEPTYPDPEGYNSVPRSSALAAKLSALNKQLAPYGVHMDFGSFNNAMGTYAPGADGMFVTYIADAALSSRSSPGTIPSGYALSGKPAGAVDVGVPSAQYGIKAILPVALSYSFTRDELVNIFGQSDAERILTNPASNVYLIFSRISIHKEVTSGNASVLINLVPGVLSPESGIAGGLLKLEGGGRLGIFLSFLALDSDGTPSFERGQLVVPDGALDGVVKDPVWMLRTATAPTQPQPSPGGSSSSGGGGCNAGLGFFAVFTALCGLAAGVEAIKCRKAK
jgi:subtilisin family serine protease